MLLFATAIPSSRPIADRLLIPHQDTGSKQILQLQYHQRLEDDDIHAEIEQGS